MTFWMNQRMDFNFVDFNRDDSVNKEEFEYFLNNPVNLTQQAFEVPQNELFLMSEVAQDTPEQTDIATMSTD